MGFAARAQYLFCLVEAGDGLAGATEQVQDVRFVVEGPADLGLIPKFGKNFPRDGEAGQSLGPGAKTLMRCASDAHGYGFGELLSDVFGGLFRRQGMGHHHFMVIRTRLKLTAIRIGVQCGRKLEGIQRRTGAGDRPRRSLTAWARRSLPPWVRVLGDFTDEPGGTADTVDRHAGIDPDFGRH